MENPEDRSTAGLEILFVVAIFLGALAVRAWPSIIERGDGAPARVVWDDPDPGPLEPLTARVQQWLARSTDDPSLLSDRIVIAGAVLGALAVPATYSLARLVFGSIALAVMASVLVAVNPELVARARTLSPEITVGTILLLSVAALARLRDREGGLLSSVVAGGFLALASGLNLLVLPLAGLLLLWAVVRVPRFWVKELILFCFVATGVGLGWQWYRAGVGERALLDLRLQLDRSIHVSEPPLADRAEPATFAELGRRILDNPNAWLAQRMKNAVHVWTGTQFWDPQTDVARPVLEPVPSPSPPAQTHQAGAAPADHPTVSPEQAAAVQEPLPVTSAGATLLDQEVLAAWTVLLLALTVCGMRWSHRYRARAALLTPVWIVWPLVFVLTEVGPGPEPRYVIDPILHIFAAFALVCLVPGFGRRLRHPTTDTATGRTEQ